MNFFHKNKSKRAFTLPEMIISVSVLVMVLVAVTNLLVSIIRSNSENVNTLIAYQLAQEGLEGMRNIRDSDWLLNADFDGTLFGNKVWEESLPVTPGTIEFYTLDYHYLSNDVANLGEGVTVKASEIAQYAPWKLKKLPVADGKPDAEESQLYIQEVALGNNTKQVRYTHDETLGSAASLFHRYIRVETLGYDGAETTDTSKVFKYRISSVVAWKEFGRDKEVSLTTELTNWKGGPL